MKLKKRKIYYLIFTGDDIFKVKYISDNPSPYFKKGEVYDAFLPRDNKSGKFFALRIENDAEPGDYAFPSDRFEIVK